MRTTRERIIGLTVGVTVAAAVGVTTTDRADRSEPRPVGLAELDLSNCEQLRAAWMGSSDFDELTILSQWMMDAGC